MSDRRRRELEKLARQGDEQAALELISLRSRLNDYFWQKGVIRHAMDELMEFMPAQIRLCNAEEMPARTLRVDYDYNGLCLGGGTWDIHADTQMMRWSDQNISSYCFAFDAADISKKGSFIFALSKAWAPVTLLGTYIRDWPAAETTQWVIETTQWVIHMMKNSNFSETFSRITYVPVSSPDTNYTPLDPDWALRNDVYDI